MPVCWRASLHPDKALSLGMLSDLVAAVRPTGARPLVVHTDGGSVCMTDEWRGACEAAHVTRSMSRKSRSPDNARAGGYVLRHITTLMCRMRLCAEWAPDSRRRGSSRPAPST